MRELSKQDRSWLESLFEEKKWDSFYHYFPLLYAISESTETIHVKDGNLFVDDKTIYFPYDLDGIDTVLVALNKPSQAGWVEELYDVNYIYELSTTLQIKNFRDNVKKFAKRNSNCEYSADVSPEDGWKIIKRWYGVSKRLKFTDFGYTVWLAENFREFKDLKARIVRLGDKPVAFSLWGKLWNNVAIHLICKDVGIPYLQDFTRYSTYKEMEGEGIELVNDGSDCGEYGIRVYKTKLRPRFIIPIYSWRWFNAGKR